MTWHRLLIANPLDGVVPDFSILGAEFTEVWQKVAAAAWGLCIAVAVLYLMHGIVGIATNRNSHPGQLREAKKEAVNAGIALAGLIMLAVIVGAIIAIFG